MLKKLKIKGEFTVKFRITEDTKIIQILEHYPDIEPVLKDCFNYFYENRLEDILLKRLSLKGAFNVLDFDKEKREEILNKILKATENKI